MKSLALFSWETYRSYLFMALMLSFSLPMQLQTLIAGVWIISMVIVAWQQKISITRKEGITLFFFTGSFLLYVAMYARTPAANYSYIHFLLERKVSLFLFPLPALITMRYFKNEFFKNLIWFPVGVTAKFLFTHILFLFQEKASLIFQSHVAYRDTFNEVAGIHPTYFGMYLVFAILILQYGQVNHFLKRDVWRRVWQLMLLFFLILLSPKSPMLAFVLIAIIDVLWWSQMKLGKKVGLISGAIIFFTIAWWQLPMFHDRVQEVFEYATLKGSTHGGTSMEMRQLIFQTDMALLKENWLYGLGPFALEEKMNQAFYLFSLMHQQSFGFYNTHNEYINQWLCFGVVGILYFMTLLGVHGIRAFHTRNHLYIGSFLLLVICFMTENILSRQHGILFFALFMGVFYFQKDPSKTAVSAPAN